MSSAYLQANVCEHKTWRPFWSFAAAIATCPTSEYHKTEKNLFQKAAVAFIRALVKDLL